MYQGTIRESEYSKAERRAGKRKGLSEKRRKRVDVHVHPIICIVDGYYDYDTPCFKK